MLLLPLIVVGLAIAGGVAYLNYKAKQRRIAELYALAAAMGFQFSVDDPGNLLGLGFELFGRGDGRSVEYVMWGEHEGLPMRLFNYTYYEQTRDSQGHAHRTYHRFTCGLVSTAIEVPHFVLGHEGFFSKLGKHVGFHDIELESDEFNRRFRVGCDDQRFAFALLDGRMMEWLMQADGFEALEAGGSYVLVAGGQLEPEEWSAIPMWLTQFHARIPRVVFSTYPATTT